MPSFLSTFPSAATLPCADCRRLFPKKDLWVCLSCPTSLDLRCGRGADSACAIEHAKDTKHGLVMNTLNRMIWCYFCDTEVLDEYGQRSSSSGVLPQKIRHCIDPSDPQVDPEEEQHTKPARQRRKSTTPDDALSESGDEEEEALTWFDYYNNPKGGEVGFSNLGNTWSVFRTTHLSHCAVSPPGCSLTDPPLPVSLCFKLCQLRTAGAHAHPSPHRLPVGDVPHPPRLHPTAADR